MTLKEFLQDKTLTAIEIYNTIVLNVYIGYESQALDVDTSNIPGGSTLTTVTDFTIEGDLLKAGDIELDMTAVNILENREEN